MMASTMTANIDGAGGATVKAAIIICPLVYLLLIDQVDQFELVPAGGRLADGASVGEFTCLCSLAAKKILISGLHPLSP